MTADELIQNFSLFDEWEDRYRYIIDLGKKLPNLPSTLRTPENKVQGCVSQVWLIAENQGNQYQFQADSDAFIVKGLAAILLIIFNNKTKDEITQINVKEIFEKLGLSDHLSPTRRNGFFSMVEKIKTLSKST